MFSTLETECSQAFCTFRFHFLGVFDSVQWKSSCWLLVPPSRASLCPSWLAGSWALPPGRQSRGCGAAWCVWHSQGALGSAPSWMHIFHWSVKPAAVCPGVCVLCIERCSQCPQVFGGDLLPGRCEMHILVCQTLQRPIPSSGLVSHPCLFKTGVTSLANDTSWGKSCTV